MIQPRSLRTWRTAVVPTLFKLLAFLLGLSMTSALAAGSSRPGSIQGRVLNATNGNYLSKARVIVEGTNLEAFTNDFGEYRLEGVPAGPARVTVTYLGRQAQTDIVNVPADAVATHNVQLGEGAKVAADGTVQLNEYVVQSERYNNARDIALNEERYSVNIKNVIAADAFGDIPSGNVGEFIKFLPGVELEYGGTYIAPTDAFGVSVRGFGAEDTAIYIDGVPVASASQASLTTQVGLDMLSINNASRVELIKVPTPDMPMNSVGGQINLISKSAFEYARPQLSLQAYVTMNSEHPNPFAKVAGPQKKKVFAGQPGFSLTYARPVNKSFGFTITASRYSQYTANRRFRPEWGTKNVNLDLRPFGGQRNTPASNDVGPVDLSNPFMTRVSVTDSPRTNTTNSASLKADWRPVPGLTLTGSYQISTYKAADAARRLQFRIQSPQSWDANSTISYPYLSSGDSASGSSFNPKSSLSMNIDSRDKEGLTHTGYVRATYQHGAWDIYAQASASSSRASFKDFQNGHFSTVDLSADVGQIKFENIVDGVPGSITAFTRDGDPLDYTQLDRWNPQIQGRSGKAESLDDKFTYKLDVARDLDFLPWRDKIRLTAKTGWYREETLKKKWGLGTGYRMTYAGPALSVDDYLDDTYVGVSPGWGLPSQQWISTYRLYDIYAAHPNDFVITDADAVNNYYSQVGQNKRIRERSDAYYAQISGQALHNRLNFIIGARKEDQRRTGQGPMGDGKWNYLKNPDGTLYRNIDLLGGAGTVRIDQSNSPLFASTTTGSALRADLGGKGITFPTSIVTSSSLAGAMLQRRMLQEVRGETKGKPSPSINVAYNLTANLIAKVAWSRTFGNIPIEDATRGLLSGNQNDFKITESDDPTAVPRGTISVANPNLLPEISTNWDFELSYYTPGGKLSASYYTKKIDNFSDTLITTSTSPEFPVLLNSLGLDPTDYQDWELRTSVNGLGTGKVNGWEFEVQQDLRILPWLGTWGRHVNLFATYSRTHRSESNTTRISARPAASQLATGGINVSLHRLSVSMKATWRDLTYTGSVGNYTIGGTTYVLGQYTPSQTKVDLNLNYQLTRRYSLFLTGRDIFNTGSRSERFDLGGIYPAYAHWDDIREFGTEFTVGVKAVF
jgi:TonB-dependent receptor